MPKKTDRKADSERFAEWASGVLDDLKAENLQVLDVRHLTSIMDIMIVASGRSDRHVRAMADALLEQSAEIGRRPLGVEGQDGGEWVLVDFADVVVHLMLPKVRDFYDIEKLWDISKPAAGAAAER